MALSAAAISARMLTAGLPTLPATVAKLKGLISAGDAPIQVITDVISTDPAITALIIGQANASGRSTSSLADAIRHNGLGVVLATVNCAIPVDERNRGVLSACWAQANVVAALVPLVAEHRRYHLRRTWDPEILRVCGLIHDLGHVLALTHFPEAYAAAMARGETENRGFAALLEAELGLGLAPLSEQACTGWSLPPQLATVMSHWRQPLGAPKHTDLCAIVQVAHMLAMAIGFTAGADRFVEAVDEWTLATLDLRIADFEALVPQALDAADELAL